MYGYLCEYCDGTVREKTVKREVFKHKNGFVILEDVPIGVCDKCGTRYSHASLLKRVAEIADGKVKQEKTEQVPVAHFVAT
jgi:YgiT-type zinc finger domain-containing protein